MRISNYQITWRTSTKSLPAGLTKTLTQPWQEDHKQLAGIIVFPKTDLDSEGARLWAVLATEMGANPSNWVADKPNSIQEPASEFGVARKIAYQKSQDGRSALEPDFYQSVFRTAEITPAIAQELKRRNDTKLKAGHICQAPQSRDGSLKQKALNCPREVVNIVGRRRKGIMECLKKCNSP